MTIRNLEITIENLIQQITRLIFIKFMISKRIKTWEQLVFFYSITQEIKTLAKTLRLQLSILRIHKLITKKRNRRFLRRMVVSSSTILGIVFFPWYLRPVFAMDRFFPIFEKTKNNFDDFFFKTTEKGTKSVKIRNALLTALGLTLGGTIFILLNNEDSVFNRLLFRPKSIIAPVSFVALTLAEREDLKNLLIQAKMDLHSRQLIMKGIGLTSSFQQLKGGNVLITASNAKRIMKLFARLILTIADTSHLITGYEYLANEKKYLYPALFVKIGKEILPTLNIYKSSFLQIFEDFIRQNDPVLAGFVVNYFYSNMETLIQRNDLQSNEVIFNTTVNGLLAALNQEQEKMK